MNFPILGDADRKVSKLYDMIHPEANDTLTVRSVFIIDPNKKLRLSITYPASTGRNFQEILRVIDSLQLTDHYSVATPVDWKQGEDCVIVPSLKDPAGAQGEISQGLPRVEAVSADDFAATAQVSSEPHEHRFQDASGAVSRLRRARPCIRQSRACRIDEHAR